MGKMTIIEVSADEYQAQFPFAKLIYGSTIFANLNQHKSKTVRYLLFHDTKIRFGIILGQHEDKKLCSPFSAPFGGLEYKNHNSIDAIEHAYSALSDLIHEEGKQVNITLPPYIYDPDFVTMQANVLSRLGKLVWMDVNYSFPVSRFSNYEAELTRAGKKNLHQALGNDFHFKRLDSREKTDVERAYRIIERNRSEHGYPLRMTLSDVLDTIRIIPADFFVLTYKGIDVAAAQVFYVTKEIGQVIYWGDLHEFSSFRTMNRLAYEMFCYYHKQGNLQILDIGPSSEQGIPNVGLCNFKESIGCLTSPKFVFNL